MKRRAARSPRRDGHQAAAASLRPRSPVRELTFSLGQSERVSSATRAIEGSSGELTVRLATFCRKARDEDVSESYMLAGALTDDGQWLDEEYVADVLDLACAEIRRQPVAIDESRFAPHLEARRAELEKEVQGRNSRYYDQQEELFYRNQQDRKPEHEGKIRDYCAKEKEARKLARQADDPMEQLRLKREARKWEQRAEDADEEYRDARKQLRAEVDKYLERSSSRFRELRRRSTSFGDSLADSHIDHGLFTNSAQIVKIVREIHTDD